MMRRSLAFSFVDKFAGIAMNLATMAVVARLLTPAEVGLFLVASAAIILIETFRDFGIGPLIVQATELSPRLVRTGFTLMALLSAAMAAVLLLGADAFAGFYGEPELAPMLRVSALAFALAPFAAPILALLRRDMAFDRVARISIAAALVNSGTTVTLAALGFGPMSFIWAAVLAAAVTAAGALACRPDLSIFRPTLTEWREVIRFGAYSSVVTLLNLLFDFLPRLILGRALGFGPVGLYGRAVTLCQLPERAVMMALQPVLLSSMAAEARRGGSLEGPYLRGIANLSVVQWPTLVCLALLADPLVRVLLGGQWLGVVPLVQILALAGLSLFPVYLSFPVLVAAGRMQDMVRITLLTLPVCVLVVLVAAQGGIEAVAWSAFLTGPIQAGVALVVVRRHVPFAWGELAAAMRRSALVTLCAAAPPLAVLLLTGADLSLTVPEAALAGAGAVLGWLAGLRLARHPFEAEVLHAGGVLRRAVLRPA